MSVEELALHLRVSNNAADALNFIQREAPILTDEMEEKFIAAWREAREVQHQKNELAEIFPKKAEQLEKELQVTVLKIAEGLHACMLIEGENDE